MVTPQKVLVAQACDDIDCLMSSLKAFPAPAEYPFKHPA